MRHGLGDHKALKPATPNAPQVYQELHTELLAHEYQISSFDKQWNSQNLFSSHDRATRQVFVAHKKDNVADSARSILSALHRTCLVKIVRLLIHNGREFVDGLLAAHATV